MSTETTRHTMAAHAMRGQEAPSYPAQLTGQGWDAAGAEPATYVTEQHARDMIARDLAADLECIAPDIHPNAGSDELRELAEQLAGALLETGGAFLRDMTTGRTPYGMRWYLRAT